MMGTLARSSVEMRTESSVIVFHSGKSENVAVWIFENFGAGLLAQRTCYFRFGSGTVVDWRMGIQA
jgi:hypothetical protein